MFDRRTRNGFSLVELLVVTGIIAVLLAIIASSLAGARAASRRTRCLANLRQIGAANAMYVIEFPGWNMPAFWGWSPASPPLPANTPPPVPPSGPRHHWHESWPVARALNATKPGNGRFDAGLLCPDAPLSWDRGNTWGYPLQHSYGINRTQLPGTKIANAPDYWNAWRTSAVRRPSEKIQFADSTGATLNVSGSFNATLRYWAPGYGERHEAPDKTNILAYRHRRGSNLLYYDGHAEWQPDGTLRYDPADTRTKPNLRQWQPSTP